MACTVSCIYICFRQICCRSHGSSEKIVWRAKRKTKSPKAKASVEPIGTFTLKLKRTNSKSVEYVGDGALYFSEGRLFVRKDRAADPTPKTITFGISW